MLRIHGLLLSIFLLSGTIASAIAGTEPAQRDKLSQLLAAVDHRYADLRTLTTDFTENYNGAGVARTETGTLLLKRPGRMRWDYQQPTKKLFVSDGKTAYFYVPGERQARKTPIKNVDDLRSPLRYLLGKAKLEKELESAIITEGVRPKVSGNVVISGVPKHMADRVSRVMFEISPQSQIQRIVIEEIDGSVTEFQFSNIVENAKIADQQFHFTAPPGVETIEATEFSGD